MGFRRTVLLSAIALAVLGADSLDGDEPIPQGAWARMLADGVGFAGISSDEDAAKILGGGRGAATVRPVAKLEVAEAGLKSWRYDFLLPEPGVWLLSTKNPVPAFFALDANPSVLVPAAPSGEFSDAGHYPLLAGGHVVQVRIAQSLPGPDIALVPGCRVVAPAGGWAADAPLTWAGLARTLIDATRQGGRLAATDAATPVAVKSNRVAITVPFESSYTVLLSGRALEGASYRVDGCEENRRLATMAADGWREGATLRLPAGEHVITFARMNAAESDGKVRLVRRASDDAAHLAVLADMGVKLPEPQQAAAGAPVIPQLATRAVTRAEARAVLATPAIARLLARKLAVAPPTPPPPRRDREEAGTLVQPVTGVLADGVGADPF